MYARRAQVGPVLSNQHPQDFIYCRLYVSDKETARQDDIRREFGMGLAFASEALDLGGRVLICCPTGCRLAVAATVALDPFPGGVEKLFVLRRRRRWWWFW